VATGLQFIAFSSLAASQGGPKHAGKQKASALTTNVAARRGWLTQPPRNTPSAANSLIVFRYHSGSKRY